MLGRPDDVEAALLYRDRELRRPHRVVGEEHRRAEFHAATPVPSLERWPAGQPTAAQSAWPLERIADRKPDIKPVLTPSTMLDFSVWWHHDAGVIGRPVDLVVGRDGAL